MNKLAASAALLLTLWGFLTESCKKSSNNGGESDQLTAQLPPAGSQAGPAPTGGDTAGQTTGPTPPLEPVPSETPSVTPTAIAGSVDTAAMHVVFVSSERYDGNLGGIAGADTKCQDLASKMKLGGTWKAIISQKNTDARSRINISKPVVNVKGEQIVPNAAALWDERLERPIKYDETGATPPMGPDANDNNNISDDDDRAVSLNFVWTGSDEDGEAKYSLFGGQMDCDRWTSNSTGSQGGMGRFDLTGERWIDQDDSGDAFKCVRKRHLYCISQ